MTILPDDMADEEALLINGNQSKRQTALLACKCTRFKSSFVHTKGGLIVIIWSLLLGLLFELNGALLTHLQSKTFLSVSSIVIVVCYLLYPVFGLLGEKWMRFKVIVVGSSLMSVSYIVLKVITLLVVHHIKPISESKAIWVSFSFVCVPFLLGYVLLGANLIQFGVDQFQFSPSHEISSFIHWYFFALYFCVTFDTTWLSVLRFATSKDSSTRFEFVTFGSGLVIIGTVFCFVCCFRRHLILEPAQNNNPVLLIWKVMRYAQRHRQPVRRSAFTYGETIPSGLDLAKERYGGLFTTLMVENVKSFWYILVLLITTYGFIMLDNTTELASMYSILLDLNGPVSFLETITLKFSNVVSSVTIIVGLLVHQLVIVPFFPKYVPSMLKRIWFGLVAVVLQLGVLTIISCIIHNNMKESFTDMTDFCLHNKSNLTYLDIPLIDLHLPHYSVLLIPQFLSGIAIILIFVSCGSFIVAQGPHNMQGLLIGLWLVVYSLFGVHLASFIPSLAGCNWYYYAVKTIIAGTSVVAYSIAAYRYKYRQCNELSDINERNIITQYTERQINNRENNKLFRYRSSQ